MTNSTIQLEKHIRLATTLLDDKWDGDINEIYLRPSLKVCEFIDNEDGAKWHEVNSDSKQYIMALAAANYDDTLTNKLVEGNTITLQVASSTFNFDKGYPEIITHIMGILDPTRFEDNVIKMPSIKDEVLYYDPSITVNEKTK